MSDFTSVELSRLSRYLPGCARYVSLLCPNSWNLCNKNCVLWPEVENFAQPGSIEYSGRMMIVSTRVELSLQTRPFRYSVRYITIFPPEVEIVKWALHCPTRCSELIYAQNWSSGWKLKLHHQELHSLTGCREFLPGRLYLILPLDEDVFYQRSTQSSDLKVSSICKINLNSPANSWNFPMKNFILWPEVQNFS